MSDPLLAKHPDPVEKTADEVAQIFKAAGSSVMTINQVKDKYQPEDQWKASIQRNVDHLEGIKTYKKLDGTTSIWTNEDFTAIDAAITAGKARIA